METDYSNAANDLKAIVLKIQSFAVEHKNTLKEFRFSDAVIEDAVYFLGDLSADLSAKHERVKDDLAAEGGYAAAMRTQAIIEDRRSI